MKRIKKTLALIIFAALTNHAYALNFGFMDNGPSGYYTDADFKIMESTATKVLSSTKDGKKVTWKNNNTTAWGYFIPVNTTTENGVTCRYLKIFQSAKSVTNLAEYKFCKINNDWRIAN